MQELPLRKIPGVGGKMAERLSAMGMGTCGQFRAIDRFEWVRRLGAYGAELHERCWGRDERPVTVDSPRKSLSIENTFTENIRALPELEREMRLMLDELEEKLSPSALPGGETEVRRLPPHDCGARACGDRPRDFPRAAGRGGAAARGRRALSRCFRGRADGAFLKGKRRSAGMMSGCAYDPDFSLSPHSNAHSGHFLRLSG